ncbi:type I polyketide synthase [Streptomyces sp. YU58]|uniref:type I polyketide synthase n=1 Tax=Streptomyces sp. SX92 TaxID=3158972 RepID=UPI0027BB1A47|nr:type I polyketide synthase [Streptomyces coralus]WLW50153.1 type I polyketide synthase [Streptomyces coralus]
MTELRQWLRERLAEMCALPVDRIDIDRPFRDHGLSSRQLVALSGRLAQHLGTPLAPAVVFEHPTVRRLADHLTGPAEPTASRPPAAAPLPRRDGAVLAVVGIGCRLPGGITSPAGFWEFLRTGGDAVRQVPEDRWETYRSASPAHATVLDRTMSAGGYLDEIEGFDAEFFGISPAEAAEMDPQQRMFLEVAWESLEHAGIPADSLAGTRTGVFVGASGDDFARHRMDDLPGISGWSLPGSTLSVIAARPSYLLDLRGPSLTVDTACSSSLVALHLAAQSLLSGESDLALVGGVNILLSPGGTVYADQAGASSPSGRCRPFDASADGIVRGEGCVGVVLKRYDDAIRDEDRVLALVRGTATNQDGRSNGMTAPSPAAQESLLLQAYERAGIAPGAVGYVEAHGTGTRLGDPIEAGALGRALGGADRAHGSLLIGSVKSNVGHLEAAAGLAGLVKSVLALHHGQIPPTLHFTRPDPALALADLGLRVVSRLTPWPAEEGERVAGVSSFGIGGTNAHAVLSDPPRPVRT